MPRSDMRVKAATNTRIDAQKHVTSLFQESKAAIGASASAPASGHPDESLCPKTAAHSPTEQQWKHTS
eukprot:scaffold2480_cov122-Isochrysis_galbana.AAC.3